MGNWNMSKLLHRVLAAAAAIAALSAAAHASAANLLANGDFEANGGSLDGWTVTLNGQAQLGALTAAIYHPCCSTTGSEPAYSSNHFAEFDDGNVTGLAILSQSFNSILGAAYTLDFDLGAFGNGHNDVLVAGQTFSQSFTVTGDNNNDTTFHHQTIAFTGTGGVQTIAFAVNGGERDNTDALLDNVVLSGGAPEPAAWALMLTGFAGLGAALRRRPKTAVA
jgi:hypothetical protein